MVENNTNVTDIGYVPATVFGSSQRHDGMVLHTRGDDHKSDIRLFDDEETPAIRVGNMGDDDGQI